MDTPRRIVVTGSKGDVGRFVVDHVKQQGDRVLGVDIVGRGNLEDAISADLGHSKLQTTIDLYGHMDPKRKAQNAALLSGYWPKPKGKRKP